MKTPKLSLLALLTTLTACGGGGGGGGTGATPGGGPNTGLGIPERVVESNRQITSMQSEVVDKEEIIEYVEDKLGPDYYTEPTAEAGADTSRRAATSRAAGSGGATNLTVDQKYAQAIGKIKDMNELLTKTADELKALEDQNLAARLHDAWLLAGKDESDINAVVDDVEALITYIEANKPDENDIKAIVEQNTPKNISDVKLMAAVGDGKAFMKFNVDEEGKIIGAILDMAEDGTIEYERDGNNKFVAYGVQDGDGLMDSIGEFKSKGSEVRLTYSDFGRWEGRHREYQNGTNPESESWKDDYFGLYGGYDVKEIAHKDISSIMNFSGKAVGGVEVDYIPEDGQPNQSEEANLKLEGTANLTFDPNGGTPKSTLELSFSNWYDLVITQTGNNIELDCPNEFASEARITDERFKLKDTDEENFTLKYYGDNGNPIEAVGGISVIDYGTFDGGYHDPQEPGDYKLEFNAAFGVKKQ